MFCKSLAFGGMDIFSQHPNPFHCRLPEVPEITVWLVQRRVLASSLPTLSCLPLSLGLRRTTTKGKNYICTQKYIKQKSTIILYFRDTREPAEWTWMSSFGALDQQLRKPGNQFCFSSGYKKHQ